VAPRFGMAYDVTGTQSLVVRGGIGLFFDRTAANATRASGTNPPISENVTLRFGTLQDLGTAGLAIEGAPNLGGNWEAEPDGLPASTQWNAGVQISLPFSAVLDVSYVGQHEFNVAENAAINAVDFGAAFLPENQDPTRPANATPGATALSTDLLRPIRGYGNISQQQQVAWRTFHSLQFSFNRRFSNGLSFGFNDTWSLYDHQSTNLRFDHTPDGRAVLRADQTQADELLGTTLGTVHVMRATAVWDLPDLQWGGGAKNIAAAIVNDWQVSGVWRGSTGGAYAVGFNYQSGGGNVNLTGSPNYGARVLVVGDPGGGCGDDVHRQFNTSAFAGPAPGSVGLESGTGYLRGCFVSALDLSIRRTLRLGGGRTIQLRADLFNAPNAAGITGRNTTMSLQNPLSPTTIRNLPFDEDGNLIDARSRPRGAGFGVANNYQSPRAVQLQARFTF
jgi:hypothetical protein